MRGFLGIAVAIVLSIAVSTPALAAGNGDGMCMSRLVRFTKNVSGVTNQQKVATCAKSLGEQVTTNSRGQFASNVDQDKGIVWWWWKDRSAYVMARCYTLDNQVLVSMTGYSPRRSLACPKMDEVWNTLGDIISE